MKVTRSTDLPTGLVVRYTPRESILTSRSTHSHIYTATPGPEYGGSIGLQILT